jgi:hypothetical protein
MSDSTPPEQLAKEAPLRKNLLHQTALALQGQFRNVIFDSDNRLHRLRFEVHPHKSTDDDGVELYGHLEFEGELDELLKTLRPIFPFEILSGHISAITRGPRELREHLTGQCESAESGSGFLPLICCREFLGQCGVAQTTFGEQPG